MRLRTRIILVDEHYPALQKTQSIFLFTAQEHLRSKLDTLQEPVNAIQASST